jgi:hypothetical protein
MCSFLKSTKIDKLQSKKVSTSKMQQVKKVLKLKKPLVALVAQVAEVAQVVKVPQVVKTPKILKLKKPSIIVPQKKVLILKLNLLPIPPIPTGPLTKAMEAFEALREYYESRDEPIPQSDIKWFHAELEQEKKDYTEFWADCSVTKATLDAIYRGATEDEIDMAVAKAQIEQKKKPIKETDIGPMPPHGTPEFWIWCMKRKKLRLQKEALIIAAGGTVPEVKTKPRKPKEVKKQLT